MKVLKRRPVMLQRATPVSLCCEQRERHGRVALLAVAASVLFGGSLIVALVAPSPSFAAQCENEAIRVQQGEAALALPDCRAYEMVSPVGSSPKNGKTIAAANGERFGYFSFDPYPGSDAQGLYLLATRGATGWSTETVTPPQGGVTTSSAFSCSASVFFSSELTRLVLADGWSEEGTEEVCEGDVPPLIAGEPRGVANLFVRDNQSRTYQLLDMPPEGIKAANALLQDATPDLSHVAFIETAQLTPEAPPEVPDLYEWSEGVLRLVTFLPDGAPVHGTLANGLGEGGSRPGPETQNGAASFTYAMSANGERVFFYANGNLYVRLNAMRAPAAGGGCSTAEPESACTVQVDAAEAGAAGPGGGGVFVDASADGSRAFFLDEGRLTVNATAVAGKPDLYEYDVGSGRLVDLTASASGAADVLGYSGASEDGAYVYFVATGVLTGEQLNRSGYAAVRGHPNLYLYHEGELTFIATLNRDAEADRLSWQEHVYGGNQNSGYLTARVSSNGRYIVFGSVESFSGYDNEPIESSDCPAVKTAKPCSEIYRYDATENLLTCVSCPASGERPTGPAELALSDESSLLYVGPGYFDRGMLEDGRVFFDSRTPLVPQATNGAVNVYQYEGGRASLISTGTAIGNSRFLDASASGSDVFFETGQGLVESDTDNAPSVYDARLGGGFPAAGGGSGSAGPCESSEACMSPPGEAPAEPFAASSVLSGAGNLFVQPENPSVKKAARPRSLTRAQKLARALRACHKRRGKRRRMCEAKARKRFGAKTKKRMKGGRR